jgi:glutamine cyclotransferase
MTPKVPLATVGTPGRLKMAYALLLCVAVAAAAGSGFIREGSPGKRSRTADYGYTVVRSYPHDPTAHTQGLVFFDGVLYEGTGGEGQSSLRKVELETGRVLEKVSLEGEVFGEGIAVLNGSVFQLTLKNGVCIVYDKNSLIEQHRHRYDGEGWGLTHDGEHLIMSDGTAHLWFREPADFQVVRKVTVTEGESEVEKLNELEYIEGEVWANIFRTDRIVRIAPDSGKVLGRINMAGLLWWWDRHRYKGVLNGIAYDAKNKRVFVTGKNWPRIFEIRIAPAK